MADSYLRNISGDVLYMVAEMAVKRMPMVLMAWRKHLAGKDAANLVRMKTPVGAHEQEAFEGVATLHRRFMKGDYRASYDEVGKVFEAAKVLIVLDAKMKGNIPRLPSFSQSHAFQPEPLPRNVYGQVIADTHSGVLES